ncbi:MAG: S4 domain-containing protein, partial [Nitrosopumilaceae archaeon]|nr:S4 domain-containing protein [Nitrosopumilaceae archaeon]
VTDLLARRLQTIVLKKLGFKTPYQARQAVVHGHIMIKDRVIDIPSYTVTVDEEEGIKFSPESKIPEVLQKSEDKKSEPVPDVEAAESEGTESTTEEKTEVSQESKTEEASSQDKE